MLSENQVTEELTRSFCSSLKPALARQERPTRILVKT